MPPPPPELAGALQHRSLSRLPPVRLLTIISPFFFFHFPLLVCLAAEKIFEAIFYLIFRAPGAKKELILIIIFLQVGPRGLGTRSWALHQRCLVSTSTSGTVNQGSEASKTAGGEADSGREDKSGGESNQSSDSGKPVRGGVRIHGSVMNVLRIGSL